MLDHSVSLILVARGNVGEGPGCLKLKNRTERERERERAEDKVIIINSPHYWDFIITPASI